MNNGKIISISSVKGGVGKSTITTMLAGLYFQMKKKVLIIDMDLYSGSIGVLLDIQNKKDIFMMIDALSNNRSLELKDYVTPYNKGIDILPAPKDPRGALKIESKYIPLILDIAKKQYDIVLVDTNHILDAVNLAILDNSYMTLFVITNDVADLKNMKSLMSIFKDTDKENYLTLLNNSRDTGKDYLTKFDIRNIIKTNIDYTISKNFYIKNIDKYVLKGEILTLNSAIIKFHSGDISNMKKMATDLISDTHKGGKKDD